MEGHPSIHEVGKLPSDFHQGRKLVRYHAIFRRKAQAEEVGGKDYLILHYFFLILGLKWPLLTKLHSSAWNPRSLSLSLLGMCPVTYQTQSQRVGRWWWHMVKGELFQTMECMQLQSAWIQPQLTSAVFAYWCCVGHGQRSKQSTSIMSLTPAIRWGYKWIFWVCCDYQKLELWCAQVKRDTGISDWSN